MATPTKQPRMTGFPDPEYFGGRFQGIYPRSLGTFSTGILPLPDEAMLVATTRNSEGGFYITKILADGSVATDFGNQAGTGGARYLMDTFGNGSQSIHLHRLGEDFFYAMGFREGRLSLARYDINGQPDIHFGEEGAHQRFILVQGEPVAFRQVDGPLSSLFDGKRFYVGLNATLQNGDTLAIVLCITAQGELDKAFNGTGLVMVILPDSTLRLSQLTGVGIQRHGANKGRVVVVASWSSSASDTAFYVTRFTVNGEVDMGFGERGWRRVDAAQFRYMQLVVDPRDTLKLCGSLTEGEPARTRETVFAWDADGHVDQAFNSGRAVLETLPPNVGNGNIRTPVLFQASEQPEGYRLTCVKYLSTTEERIARLTASGETDAAFGYNGRGQLSHATLSTATAVLNTLDNGKLLFARDYLAIRCLA